MNELNEGTEQEVHYIEDIDAASDFELKHTPNIEIIEEASGQTVKISIGLKGISHPQTEEHLIEWIRLFVGDEMVGDVGFGPTNVVEASFKIKRDNQPVIVQALCNLHGIWEARA
ncbi:MAG: hypothetical protein FWF71_01680 [Actinomycetia bacterium]|nr:hypothetical protein [Actinomycetes bacterium]